MNVIIKPLVTEKMTDMSEKRNRYGFIVERNADKNQIKKAIEALYGVEVESVNTIMQRGKNTSRYTKTGFIRGNKNTFKKAIVQLKENHTIDIFSNI
ncbi:MAG TPA: 50S ribosomal protein L23 [Bacteroidales bacterium]|jgi:large subunit ribosomal protein L23|nr:50S ribosomal protein L23 [Bacteroidales bacterium]HOF15587.1 50S ribosomal protein L23 [Bacteroidales bacterium]HON21525.1 50S ribosomal protein L23 [Bacteroidales bacterium]HOR81432.1 50S ribosomal protein L23 [Bacteroidales bacterium]HPJ90607.1 50S ribosomal protein L23 [Bacteroidales bacterium]